MVSPSPLVSSEGMYGRRCTWLSSHHKSDPSPLPLRDDGTHAVFVAEGEKMLVRDGLGPEYLLDSSKVLGVEGGQFVQVAF